MLTPPTFLKQKLQILGWDSPYGVKAPYLFLWKVITAPWALTCEYLYKKGLRYDGPRYKPISNIRITFRSVYVQ